MRDEPDSSTPPRALRMSIDFLFGKGFLTVRQQRLGAWGTLDELRMEVPDLRFPFDARGGHERFRRIRNQVDRFRVTLSESGLARAVNDAVEEIEGFEDIRVRFAERTLVVTARCTLLSSDGAFAVRLAPAPGRIDAPLQLQLAPIRYVTFGRLALPVQVAFSELVRRLIATPALRPLVSRWGGALNGDTIRLAPLSLILSELFLPLGWKLPGLEKLTGLEFSIRPGVITLGAHAPDASVAGEQRFTSPDAASQGIAARALAAIEATHTMADADARLFSGRFDDALEAYRSAALTPGAPDAHIHRALELLLLDGGDGSMLEALRVIQDRLHADAEDIIALQTAARMAHSGGDPPIPDAWPRLLESLRAGSQAPELLLGALEYARQGVNDAADDAEERVGAALRLAPRHPEALRLRIATARASGDFEVLEDALRRRAVTAPRRSERLEHHLELARLALHRRGDFGEARLWLERARAFAADSGELLAEMAETLAVEERHAEAIQAWDEAARLFEARGEQRAAIRARERAAALWAGPLGQPAAALGELRRARELAPEDLRLLLKLTETTARVGHTEGAMSLAQQALEWEREQTPDERIDVLRVVARVFETAGAPEVAATWRRELLELAPGDRENRVALEQWLRQTGRAEELVALYDTLLERETDPRSAAALHVSLARIQEEALHLPGRAIHHWQAALRLAPDHVEALQHLCRLHAAQGTDLELSEALERLAAESTVDRDTGAMLRASAAEAAWTGGDDVTARRLARAAVANDPRRPAPWRTAWTLLKGRERQAAAQALADLLDNPDEAAAVLVAAADDAFADPDGARQAVVLYRRALSLRDDADVRNRLQTAATRAGLDPERAARPDRPPPERAHQAGPTRHADALRPADPAPRAMAEVEPSGQGEWPDPPEAHSGTADDRWMGASAPPSAEAAGQPDASVDRHPDASPTSPEEPDRAQAACDAARVALEHARREGDLEATARALEILAAETVQPTARASHAAELGALLYHDLEETERARHWLEEARRLDPEGAGRRFEVLTALESIYDELDAPEGLLAVYREKLEEANEPSMREVFRLLMASVLFERLGRPDDALAITEDALRENPGSIPALRLQAEIRLDTGNAGGAAEALRRVLARRELDPFERQEVLRALGNIEWRDLAALGDAASRFEALLQEIPGDTECLSALKQIHCARGAWDECARVLWRELGLLVGAIGAFEDVDDVLAYPPSRVPTLLRGTCARILAEAARVLANVRERHGSAQQLLMLASSHAPDEPFVLEARMDVSGWLGADADEAQAAEALARLVLDPQEQRRLLERAMHAWDRHGAQARVAELHDLLANLAPGNAPALGSDGVEEMVAAATDGPVTGESVPTEAAESGPTGPSTGESANASVDPSADASVSASVDDSVDESVDELPTGPWAPPAVSFGPPAPHPPEPTEERLPELLDLGGLDRLAARRHWDAALGTIEAWLPNARDPAVRRELLLRKGRWIIDQTGSGRNAVLVLKGALILDEDAYDTRFELLRAHLRNRELRLAMEQLRELVARAPAEVLRGPALRSELDRLRALGEPADIARLETLLRDAGVSP